MKKFCIYTLSLACVLLLSGCRKDKVKNKALKEKNKTVKVEEKEVNIPLASNELKSYFDDNGVNLGEFVLVEDSAVDKKVADKASNASQGCTALNDASDFSWAEESQDKSGFKKLHFDFDRYDVKFDDQKNIENNIEAAKKVIAANKNATIVIQGHSCHAAGSRTYNLALSEKRAKTVADQLVAAGIPQENIKVVALGQECPEKDSAGNEITGSIGQQAPNRRAEFGV